MKPIPMVWPPQVVGSNFRPDAFEKQPAVLKVQACMKPRSPRTNVMRLDKKFWQQGLAYMGVSIFWGGPDADCLNL